MSYVGDVLFYFHLYHKIKKYNNPFTLD